mmetsp:Transcript_18629/g.24244  ORF Transcript_18629/g.24244 Transcript_18629/m.24244 type:complete len:133 (-) Transcript_18629:153-551(-)
MEERIQEIETIRKICTTSLERYEASLLNQGIKLDEDNIKDKKMEKISLDLRKNIPEMNKEANLQLVKLREERSHLETKLKGLSNHRDTLGNHIKTLKESNEINSAQNLESIEKADSGVDNWEVVKDGVVVHR